VGQIGEQVRDEPGPFGIDLDADQPGAGPRAGRQPGQPYSAFLAGFLRGLGASTATAALTRPPGTRCVELLASNG